MQTVTLMARMPSADERQGKSNHVAVKHNRISLQERTLEKKKMLAVEERLGIIRKALSVLPSEEADQIYQDILKKKPTEIIKVSQPYISKSYSLKLIDSRMINDPNKIPSLRVPLGGRRVSNQDKSASNHPPAVRLCRKAKGTISTDGRPPLQDRLSTEGANKLANSFMNQTSASFPDSQDQGHPLSPEELRLDRYVNNFFVLNEKLYQINKLNMVKPQKLKPRLPVRLSEKTKLRIRNEERKAELYQLRHNVNVVDIDFHRLYDADLYHDTTQSIDQKKLPNQLNNSRGLSEMASMRSTQHGSFARASETLTDDYNYEKNYNYYVQLNTGISRNFKMNRDKYKTGIYLGRSKQAGDELAKIKDQLKGYQLSKHMSNLDIVKNLHKACMKTSKNEALRAVKEIPNLQQGNQDSALNLGIGMP